MLKTIDLHRIYEDGPKSVHAVRGINLEVYKGEILVIIGPSGAGKSTLLHLLGGLDMPSEGSVLLDGIDLYRISDNTRARIRNERIGFVFQLYHLLPGFTALENVMLPAMIGGRKIRLKEQHRAKELLENVGLKERIYHKPMQLSGGEAQRVAIARSLMNNPEIVLCDEPTGNLDSEMSAELCNLICRLSKENNQTFVLVTHEPSLAQKADRILHIKDGMLERGVREAYESILKWKAGK